MVTRRFLSREDIARISTEILGDLLPGLAEQDVTVRSAVQRYRIGSRLVKGGRVFRYAHIGVSGGYGVTVQPTQVRVGYPVVSTIWPGNDESNVVGAGGGLAGAFTIPYVTTGVILANQFAGGHIVMDGASYGVQCEIKSHPAAGAGATVVLTLSDPLPQAIAAGEACTLYCNPYYRVISPRQAAIEATVDPNTNQWSAIGFPLVNGLEDEYIWVQTWGPAFIVAGGGTEGAAVAERHMCFNPGDMSVNTLANTIGAVQSQQIMGFIIPVTNTALAGAPATVFGGQGALLYVMLQIAP